MTLHRPSKVRKAQKLIIGPWPHHVNTTRTLGGIDFGESALLDLQETKLRWFDRWLRGARNGVERGPQVETFAMGRNAWVKRRSWPPAEMNPTCYYLGGRGRANTSLGDGVLSRRRPPDRFSYDPSNPVPNIDERGAEAPFDQRPIERRDDLLVYSTPPLTRDVEVSGPVSVRLFASTSARDTDFWAQLVDVFPNGYSMHLTEGIIRGRYRKRLDRPTLLKPGTVYDFDIDLWVTSNVFLKEHAIRLHVSSSSFPKYDRNPNTGNDFGRDSELRVAEQTVFHDSARPSCVMLPLVPTSRQSSA
jgi:uncharacterized protein